MINAFYTAKTGSMSFQRSLDITANNIANVNTQGFKAQSSSFADLLYTDIGNGVSVGSGSKIQTTPRPSHIGPYINSGSNVDVYLSGKGYFALEQSDGTVAYSRSGSFSLSQQEGVNYLTSHDGSYVLGPDLERIAVTEDSIKLSTPLDNSGTVLGMFSFANPGALEAIGAGKFLPTAASGVVSPDNETSFGQGALEGSDVDISIEMTRMIMSQRGFQLSARMIQTADEIEQITNSMGSR